MKDQVVLTRKEIGDAIVQRIGMLKGNTFYPMKIVDCKGITVEEEVILTLEYIPKGTKSDKAKHSLGGSETTRKELYDETTQG